MTLFALIHLTTGLNAMAAFARITDWIIWMLSAMSTSLVIALMILLPMVFAVIAGLFRDPIRRWIQQAGYSKTAAGQLEQLLQMAMARREKLQAWINTLEQRINHNTVFTAQNLQALNERIHDRTSADYQKPHRQLQNYQNLTTILKRYVAIGKRQLDELDQKIESIRIEKNIADNNLRYESGHEVITDFHWHLECVDHVLRCDLSHPYRTPYDIHEEHFDLESFMAGADELEEKFNHRRMWQS